MYSIDISIEQLDSENGGYCFYLSKDEIIKTILYGLHLKVGKIKSFALNGEMVHAIIGYNDLTFNFEVGGGLYEIKNETLALIVSFLLDCTNEFVWYNHIDFNLWNNGEMVDFTIMLIDQASTIS